MGHQETQEEPPAGQPRIIILGAGFGGLYLIRRLVSGLKHARITADITLIDRQDYFLFIPLLHEALVQRVEMHHIMHPIRQTLRGMPVAFHQTEVEGVDLVAQTVHTRAGTFAYDYLVLALGSVTNYFNNAHFAPYSFPLKSPDDAYCLRNHVISMFEQAAVTRDAGLRQQLLTFVLVGAGYTGLEIATELHDLIHASLLRDYPEIRPEEVRLVMIDSHPNLQVPPDPRLARRAFQVLQRKGIEVCFNTRAKDAGPGWVEFMDGQRIDTGTLIWATGVQANAVAASLPVPKGSLNRVQVLPTLQLPEHPEVFVIGDSAYLKTGEGPALLPTAQVAAQQGTAAADNLLRVLADRMPVPFRYHHRVELATLGPYHAVAEIGPIHLSGPLATLVMNLIYLWILPCWRERARIAGDWFANLFFPTDTCRATSESCFLRLQHESTDEHYGKEV